MKNLCLVAWLSLSIAVLGQSTQPAEDLADQVVRASGGDAWPRVQRIAFTFIVEQDGKPVMKARHDWDLMAGTDSVAWNGKTVTITLTGPHETQEQKAAFQRWTNDSYWLLAPLKIKDPGVNIERRGTRSLDGKDYEILHLSFDDVGLTPGDQYDLYIDPKTRLVRAWDYMPNPDRTVHFTWDDYREFNGLMLSTRHQGSGRTIRFEDVRVELKE